MSYPKTNQKHLNEQCKLWKQCNSSQRQDLLNQCYISQCYGTLRMDIAVEAYACESVPTLKWKQTERELFLSTFVSLLLCLEKHFMHLICKELELPSPLTSMMRMEKTCEHRHSKTPLLSESWAPLIFNLPKHCVIIMIKPNIVFLLDDL